MLPSGSQIPRQTALALVGLMLVVAVAPGAHATQVAPCEGDETIAFAPPAPVVGQPFVAAVSSRREHVGLWLSGPVASYEAHQWSDELGFVVWQFSFTAEWPGRHDFTVYVQSVHACATASIEILASPPDPAAGAGPPEASANEPADSGGPPAGPDQTGSLAPLFGPSLFRPSSGPSGQAQDLSQLPATATPSRAVRIIRRAVEDSSNENQETEGTAASAARRDPTSTRIPTATREPTPTRQPTPTRTPIPPPTRTPIPEMPRIDSTDPGSVLCGEPLTIRGRGFGTSRSAVNGRVRVTGLEASISDWTSNEIRISAPNGLRSQPEGALEVSTTGGSAIRDMRISC